MMVFAGVAIGLAGAIFCIRCASPVFGFKGAIVLLLVKLLAGSVVAGYYLLYAGQGDLLMYHQEAANWALELQKGYPFQDFILRHADPSAQLTPQARTLFFIKVVTFFYLATGSNVWVTAALFSLISYAAVAYFIKRLTPYFSQIAASGVAVFFFWPSVALWGSGLGKESLMLSSLLVFLGALLPLLSGNGRRFFFHAVLVVLSFAVLFKLRIFVLLVLIPCILGGVLIQRLMQATYAGAQKWQAATMGLVAIILVAVLLSYFDQSFNPGYFFTAFEKNHEAVVANSAPAHLVTGLEKLAGWPVIVGQVLLAILAGCLGPFIWEINSGWELLLLVEPVLLLVLFFTNARQKFLTTPTLVPMVVYIVALSAFITLSTPNYGTLSRYRLAYYPVLIFLAGYKHPWLTKISARAAGKIA